MLKSVALGSLLVSLLIAQVACSNLTVMQMNPSIENPELRGAKSQLGLQLGSYMGHEYTSTLEASRRPPDLSQAQLNRRSSLAAGLGYEFLERFRLSFDLDPFEALPVLKGQWQWLGPGREEAQKGAWSSSVGFQLSGTNRRKTGDQNGNIGSTGFPWEGEIRGTQSSFMLSVGHRPLDRLLLFIGGALGQMNMTSRITQLPSLDSSSQGGVYEARDQGRGTTLGLGALIGRRWLGLIKLEHSRISYGRAAKAEEFSQVLFGLQF